MSERILQDPSLLDSLLEFKFHLIERSSPETVVAAFLSMRRNLERSEFLLAFRLRQWLENQISVHVAVAESGFSAHHPLKLQGHTLRHVHQSYQREIFENDLLVKEFEDIQVFLSWKVPDLLEEETMLQVSF